MLGIPSCQLYSQQHHRLQSLHQTLCTTDQLSASPLTSPFSIYSLPDQPISPRLSFPRPVSHFHPTGPHPDMGSLSSHITCMSQLSSLKQHNEECLLMEASYLVVRTLVARMKVVQRMNTNLRFIFHFHQGIMKVLNRFE